MMMGVWLEEENGNRKTVFVNFDNVEWIEDSIPYDVWGNNRKAVIHFRGGGTMRVADSAYTIKLNLESEVSRANAHQV